MPNLRERSDTHTDEKEKIRTELGLFVTVEPDIDNKVGIRLYPTDKDTDRPIGYGEGKSITAAIGAAFKDAAEYTPELKPMYKTFNRY